MSISFPILGGILVFIVLTILENLKLDKQNKRLLEQCAALNEGLVANRVWVAKLAKMNPIDAISEIRKQDEYNQNVEADRTY